MSTRLAVTLWVSAAVIYSYGASVPVVAQQADAHARAIARASCQSGKHSEAVVTASAAADRAPDEAEPRIRLSDALVDQGCYQEAVQILEALQASHPRDTELSAKLRAVRSLVTEQTYIEGLTQAAEGAKLARNQLRCTRLEDLSACDDALKSKPDDAQLLSSRADALLQAGRATDAVTDYRHLSVLKPGDSAVEAKLAAAETLQAKLQSSLAASASVGAAAAAAPAVATRVALSPNAGGMRTRAPKKPTSAKATTVAAAQPDAPSEQPKAPAPQSSAGQHLTATPVATVAALAPSEPKTYSNDAPPGRTN
jgi:predicted Zn-dependent protease